MPEFKYSGHTLGGQQVGGVLEAKTKDEVQSFLRKQRVVVDTIKKKPKDINIVIGSGVKAIEISRFTRQFATMIEAGLPLVQCLDILGGQQSNKIFSGVINSIRDSVSSGSTLAAALGRHKKIFDDLYVNMVEAGEIGGALETVLKRLAVYREKADKLAREVKGALIYPALMAFMCVAVTFIMLTWIVPIFSKMFSDLNAELPKPTQVVLQISDFMKSNVLFIGIGIVLFIVIFSILNKKPKTKYYIDKGKLMAPLLGDLLRKTAVARFCRTLSTLMGSGVNIIDALNITSKTAGNLVLQKAIRKAMMAISEGDTITAPLEESKVFPPMVIQMINVGEETGDMEGMLTKIADFYDEEVDAAVKNLTSMIEPVIIVIMGVVIGGLLVAMYLPMFDIVGQIK
ncbi:MAG: type II secretion system F family protein [Candidatus Zixiibacteriota bacterium]